MKIRRKFNPDSLNFYSKSLGDGLPEVHRTIPLDIKLKNIAGVYVYSYSHYLRNPIDIKTGRSYFKVGMSNCSAALRVTKQNKTSIPEPPLLLRVYYRKNENARILESELHSLLYKTGCKYNVKGRGKEWFLTTLSVIDYFADTLGAESIEFHPPDTKPELPSAIDYMEQIRSFLNLTNNNNVNENVSDTLYFNPYNYINRNK